MFIRRLIIAVYLLLFVSVAAASTLFFIRTRSEYLQLQEAERVTSERLALAKVRLREQEEILRRLREDPSYVEMVIRRRLGYAKPDEQIFRFEATRGAP